MNKPIDQTHLDLLANALLLAHPQADHRRERHEIGAGGIGDRWPGLERLPVFLAGDTHEAGERLGEGVNPRPPGVGTVLAEGADRDANNLGVIFARFLVGNTEFSLGLGPQVVDDDVSGPHQAKIELPTFGLGEVENDSAFVTVNTNKVAAVVVHLGANGPRLVAIRRLDLDDVRAHIAQHRSAIGTSQHAGNIEHANPCKR